MNQNIQEINPGEGLGDIRFGWTREKLEEFLGAPDEKDAYTTPVNNDEEAASESWHYDNLELSVSFEEEDEWRLSAIAVSASDYHLKGQGLTYRTEQLHH